MSPPRLHARTAALAALALCTLPWMAGCKRDEAHQGGCLSGAQGCVLPTPCPKLTFSCPGGDAALDAVTLTTASDVAAAPRRDNALASIGDVLLTNGKATAVISGLNKQNFLDPNGGSLLDLASKTGATSDDNDAINDVFQVAGILPRDALHYESLQVIKDLPNRVAVQLQGRLDDPKVGGRVATLYEMRPCEPGIRVRTELVNEGLDTQLWFLSDTWYWSKREPLPFAPYPGGGLIHPGFGLLTINDAFKPFPYLSSSQHSAPYASYSEVACNVPQMEGINSETVSAIGPGRTVVPPREFVVFERFISVTGDHDVSGATNVSLEVRKQLFGESYVTVSGSVTRLGALTLGNEREVSLLISEGTAAMSPEGRTPWTQVVPDNAGNWTARVPAGKTYVISAISFGEKQADVDIGRLDSDSTVPAITLPATARVNVEVRALGGPRTSAHVFFVPADAATQNATKGNFHGTFGDCSPWLGPPPGSSPACNRMLSSDQGPVTLEVPAGTYDIYAFKGPFWTIDRVTMTLTPNTFNVQMNVNPLPLLSIGGLSADLHVHGAASFDSQIPDLDRVRSFDASGLDVIIATDHDVVYDYGATVRALGFEGRLSAVDGVETTGHIPFLRVPNYGFPLVIGHYNFWPLRFDRTQTHNGSPPDELIEPGTLFDNVKSLYTGAVHMAQLNHPWAEAEFGRDLGFPRAIKLDATQNLPASDDGTNNGVYVRTPPNASSRNDGHLSQEVMNGSANDTFLEYRAFWFYTLNQGQRKVGTANSDSHGLSDNIVGVPRNLVYTGTNAGTNFDVDVFDRSIADGRVLGTNGPVIVATVDAQGGGTLGYGTAPIRADESGVLHVTVAAAPWVPVEEIRIVVNGKVVKVIGGGSLSKPADPFGITGLVRFNGAVPLSELLTGVSGDAWIVVEAGSPLPLVGDLGGGINDKPDGIPDTTDNNGDGVVDHADVRPADAVAGPILPPVLPTDRTNPAYHYSAIIGGVPQAFTNPFFLDRNGNGTFEAPTVTGGR
ncbi:MAG TPA: CehA/McbA family metallohydrolase [Myxococcaceae bacterium]|nr:CehA/McbA family metallohydrolase [Myxococcaceae bacterium]